MTTALADKARAGRRVALATLNARLARAGNVVSFYENSPPRRRAVPEFHSVRSPAPQPAALPRLVLRARVAA